jgi:hypothetical protein
MIRKQVLMLVFVYAAFLQGMAQMVSNIPTQFNMANTSIYVDENDEALIQKSAVLLQQDIFAVTGKKPDIIHRILSPKKSVIIIGSLEKSSWIKQLVQSKKINPATIKNKWEAYQILSIHKPFNEINNALVIIGNDRRGAAFGVFELSKQMGISPWYWWADVPVKKQANLFINTNINIIDSPKVKYRGIFINDEAPALSNWSKEKFGGFNHLFYEKVFELMLRLKANYLWPAMWGNAFYDDDSLNIKSADEYGIVIGTSHHEPLMRAHDEWRRYGQKQKWNYDSTEAGLKEFWKEGMQRAWNEKIVSIGMRGDGDEPMSRETATALLERIVKDQRAIIEEVTNKPAHQTPQLWALYKEVQDYYDKGMRVPDDITLLLCDDNWGNIRKLPKLDEKPRKGGYGIYYHFDYVGGPRNHKWLNTNHISRIWEQMHLAWEYNARQIWIVNVGDIKPMELPISFFLDYAWNPTKYTAGNFSNYHASWAAQQFGNEHAKEIGELLNRYTQYNARRKPELLDANTYNLYSEWPSVVDDYNKLLIKAEAIQKKIPAPYQDAFFQLVLHPIKASANLNEMYYNVALNKEACNNRFAIANEYADKVKQLYANDSLITKAYHQLGNGKWNHMMSQTHIGYTYWQQPLRQKMPIINYVPKDSIKEQGPMYDSTVQTAKFDIPKNIKGNIFYELDGYAALEAAHYTKAFAGNGIQWKVLKDIGRDADGITAFPVTHTAQKISASSPHLEYEVYTYSEGEAKLQLYFSPTLNFHNSATGLQYAVSIDNETPQMASLNKDDSKNRTWEQWVANNIILKTTQHKLLKPGKHTIKFWLVDAGIVLQKIALDFGGMKPSYLGPPETKHSNN